MATRRQRKDGGAPTRRAAAHASRSYAALSRAYPTAQCALRHEGPYQLLVATILSAQCTDERVNQVTPAVFDRYPTPAALAGADPGTLEAVIRTTGFYRNKARSLIAAARDITEKFGGAVPDTMEDLRSLRGVARKTANVVLGTGYGIPSGVVVDTHVQRLARRLGLSAETRPEKIERDLMALFPPEQWDRLAHLLIWHGRQVCTARRPACGSCVLRRHCPRIGVEPGG